MWLVQELRLSIRNPHSSCVSQSVGIGSKKIYYELIYNQQISRQVLAQDRIWRGIGAHNLLVYPHWVLPSLF